MLIVPTTFYSLCNIWQVSGLNSKIVHLSSYIDNRFTRNYNNRKQSRLFWRNNNVLMLSDLLIQVSIWTEVPYPAWDGRPLSTSRSRGRGPRRCDSLWHGEGIRSMWCHTYKFFYHTYATWNLKWCLAFCCNKCILTEGGTDKNHSRQNLPDKRPPDKTPCTKPPRPIEREFVQGVFVQVFCTRPTKNEMRDVLLGVPGMCDKVWQGEGIKIGQK